MPPWRAGGWPVVRFVWEAPVLLAPSASSSPNKQLLRYGHEQARAPVQGRVWQGPPERGRGWTCTHRGGGVENMSLAKAAACCSAASLRCVARAVEAVLCSCEGAVHRLCDGEQKQHGAVRGME